MKNKVAWSLLTLVVLVGAFINFTPSASSSSSNLGTFNLMPDATTFDVDRTDDTAAATACTDADNDCTLRGAIISPNAHLIPDPVIIKPQPANTYHPILTHSTQEN